MSSSNPQDVKKEVRRYLWVFAGLIIGTIATVLAAEIDATFSVGIVIGLAIAVAKSSLVAMFFMHLKSERPYIYWCLLLTVVFFVFLMFVPLWAMWDHLDISRG